ncbi:MAG TPA: indolepyruvate oxidoreductase subunit beta family protein [Burkholderiales bacterium]|nr:indolepyruvate oxidoreductase subunit beta family protein [Burkholderiales bacterium]
MLPERPIAILIAALGGEGGGVLADWIIAAASARDYPVQSTSIPGVAQRTGATTYYVEIYPAKISELGARRPVMTLTPAPCHVDVMVASELLEAGRAMQNGFVTRERTTLIASTHRVYTVAEKMQMGDGRFDSEVVLNAARELAKRAILFDMQAQASASGTVISAVMFGALAGSATLPLSRVDCETAIRSGGKGAEASLRGFAAGFDAAAGSASGKTVTAAARTGLTASERVRQTFPEETRAMLEEGAARCAGFQDRGYARLYLDRLEPIVNLDHAADSYRLTNETGRFLALWMCYEDVIRVADLKTRRSRFERVRGEVQAKPHEPVRIIEFLKPGVDELTAVLPRFLARAVKALAQVSGFADKLNIGMHVKTTSVSGFLALRFLAWLRPLRPLTSRWHEEQALIGRWLAAIATAAKRDVGLALEIALCGRLIKGYGDTHRRAKGNFLRILDTLVEGDALSDDRARIEAIRKAREAALADPEGRKLELSLETHGIAPLPPKPKPVKFMRRPQPENHRVV